MFRIILLDMMFAKMSKVYMKYGIFEKFVNKFGIISLYRVFEKSVIGVYEM